MSDLSRRNVLRALGGGAIAITLPVQAQTTRHRGEGTSSAIGQIKALAFDVFGTVVDWRGSVIRDRKEPSRRTGVKTDWGAFADAWRGE